MLKIKDSGHNNVYKLGLDLTLEAVHLVHVDGFVVAARHLKNEGHWH